MPKNGHAHKLGLIDGHDWSFYFDAEVGAKVTFDGETIGELSTADLKWLMKADKRDADLGKV